MALLPAAALLFRRADLPPLREETELRVHDGSVPELLGRHGPGIGTFWESAGGRRLDFLEERLSVTLVPRSKGRVALAWEGKRGPARDRPLRWERQGTDNALFTADSPSSKVMVGFVAGRKLDVGGWRVEGLGKAPGFAALTLSALDGKPAPSSRSLLLTAVGRVENVGMGWNADRTSVGNTWGKGPTRAEGISARVSLPTRAKAVTVHALDGTGKRKGKVKVNLDGGRATFTIGPAHRTLWYEIEAR
jgi:hypothetical protein